MTPAEQRAAPKFTPEELAILKEIGISEQAEWRAAQMGASYLAIHRGLEKGRRDREQAAKKPAEDAVRAEALKLAQAGATAEQIEAAILPAVLLITESNG